MLSEFSNHPLVDFSKPENHQKMLDALEDVRGQFNRVYPLHINGREVITEQTFQSFNPCSKDEVVGTFHMADKIAVENAIAAAETAFKSWRHTAPVERAEYLFKASEVMRRRQMELNAWMVYEVGKNWVEADADSAEAIDFLEFYGREMLRYSQPEPLTPIPNEINELQYIPLGIGAIIPPWNFPLAILTGMTTAAIVAGNCVLLKPASDSPTIGHKLMEIMQEVGLPAGVLNFIPGSGAQIGDHIVTHPKIRFISFTGSKEVGLRINELAAKTPPGQIWIKRIAAEMGGKDAIIVDADCDLDAAVEGVALSAFGYQGQKCSACSRAIIDAAIYDEFVARLAQRTAQITVGPVEDPDYFMGAVINASAQEKWRQYVEIGKRDGELVYGGEYGSDEGYFVQPTIFKDIESQSQLAQEEVFAPLLAVIRANNYEHALEIANDTEYGLTGALYSNDPEKLGLAKEHFHVGNLYLNRKCTGALVGGNPFGGFNMSGTDSKAGGRDYLLLFLQAKAISEKV